jgi:hypothetical protein
MLRRVDRAALAAFVLVAHVGWLTQWGSRAPARLTINAAQAQAPLIVRLVPSMPAPPPPTQRAPSVAPRARASSLRAAPTIDSAAPVAAQAITTMTAPPEPAASAPVERALNTVLPASTARTVERSIKDRLLNDPRSNSPRATLETRVAGVAGTVELVEERMDATRLRVKQRGACVEVHVSRDAQTNPWNQSHSPTPKIVKPSC